MKTFVEIIIRALITFIITITLVSGAMALAGAEECGIITKLDTHNIALQMDH